MGVTTEPIQVLWSHNRLFALVLRRTQERDKDKGSVGADNSNHHELEEGLKNRVQPPHVQDSLVPAACPHHHLQTERRLPESLCLSTPGCLSCTDRNALHHRPIDSQSHISVPQTPRNCTKNNCANCVCFVDSFSSLSVSSSPAAGHMSSWPQSLGPRRTCREEAAAVSSRNCLDDTTVDDLAGYLDEIMFIPKPMSEMAELMYT